MSQARRAALEEQLATSADAPARDRAALYAELADVVKDLYYADQLPEGITLARQHIREALKLMPDSAHYHVVLGRRHDDDSELKVACCTRALELGGDDDNAYKERGYAFSLLRHYQAAREDWLRVVGHPEGWGDPAEEAEKAKEKLAEGKPGSADELGASMLARRADDVRGQKPAATTAAGTEGTAGAEKKPSIFDRLPGWWLASTFLVGVLWVVVYLIYVLGGTGISAHGAEVSFNRQFDRQLYRINDELAFSVGDTRLEVSRYRETAFPFNFLCGWYEPAGYAMYGEPMTHGDWIFSDYPGSDREETFDAYNLKTGDKLRLSEKERADLDAVLAVPDVVSATPLYKAHGFVVDDANRLTREEVVRTYEHMSTFNESLMAVQMAFLLLAGFLVITGLVSLVFGKAPLPDTPTAPATAST